MTEQKPAESTGQEEQTEAGEQKPAEGDEQKPGETTGTEEQKQDESAEQKPAETSEQVEKVPEPEATAEEGRDILYITICFKRFLFMLFFQIL